MENKREFYVKRKTKKIISIFLTLLFITSAFTSHNLVYAEDNGELVIKSMNHSEAKRIEIDGTKITITLPFGYKSETFKLEGIQYTYEPKFRSIEISFPSGDEAEIDGPSVIMDVSYSYIKEKDAPRYSTQYYVYVKKDNPVAENIKYAALQGEIINFNLNDFVNASSKTVGGTLDYIVFPSLPSSERGKLYLDDTLVVKGKGYNRRNISKISFVPYEEYFGTFTISYEGYNEDGYLFTGKIEITYIEDSVDADIIKYSTYENMPVNFVAGDFNSECKATTGRTLDYVKFTLPPKSRGMLYYNYGSTNESKVSENEKYYRRDLDNITFVPYEGYRGSVTISYVGYNDRKGSYTGEVEISVSRLNTDAATIIYKTGSYTPLKFDSDDFIDACWDATGRGLDYIKFTIPSSVYGTFYTDYRSASRYGTKVSNSTKYYESDLDEITFVPSANYSGTFTLLYTGYNSRGKSYTGAVKITVNKEVPVADVIKLSIKENTFISFDDEDFNKASKNATGEKLDYVKFNLPPSKHGKLYYKYTSPNKFDSAVTESKKYYYDTSPYLLNVVFVPYKNYTGKVEINYTGFNIKGNSFTGKVRIEVVPAPKSESSEYFKDVTKNYGWCAHHIDYLFKKGIVSGTGNNRYNPELNMIRGDFMLMLHRALGLDAKILGNFRDVPKDSYYYKAIATAKSLGIAKGYNDFFMPKAGITREDAMVLVDRALKIQGKRLTAGKESDLKDFKDRDSISDYAVTSVATLVKAGIIQGNNSYLNPKSYISRAEMAVILYRIIELE